VFLGIPCVGLARDYCHIIRSPGLRKIYGHSAEFGPEFGFGSDSDNGKRAARRRGATEKWD
jgi:hypothetical protein